MDDSEAQRRRAHAQDVALFRYALVREAADPALSAARRGQLVRAVAEATHRGPDGEPVRVSRQTLDRWIRTYRAGGFQALVPSARRVEPRTPAGLLELACQLRKEDPHRSATHIAEILRAVHDWSPHPRTLQRHFKTLGLTRPQLSATAHVNP